MPRYLMIALYGSTGSDGDMAALDARDNAVHLPDVTSFAAARSARRFPLDAMAEDRPGG